MLLSSDSKAMLPEDLPPASENDVVDFFIQHIDNPCGMTVPGHGYVTGRHVYLKAAKQLLPMLTDPGARDRLQKKIDEYRQP